ncbi:S41 family peptidase [uncultured Kordia sp.]|uniref:S41 family peptidase n=1 Tax=uncultured Kordia sp. TaxID=507699 RepID=UPI00262D8718|nr:S41 family peptidase [uncultured Kordia sp.]
MKKLKTLIFLVTIIFLLKCKSNTRQKTENKTSEITATINGTWKSIGYGRIVNITDEVVSLYDVNNINCLPSEEFPREVAEQFLSLKLKNENTLKVKMGITTYDFVRLEKMPKNCAPLSEAEKNDPLFNFESLWQTFNEHYSYFKERNIDWNVMKSKYKSKLSSESSSLELYVVLQDMLKEMKDGHVGIPLPEEIAEEYVAYKKSETPSNPKKQRKKINFDEFKFEQFGKYVSDYKTYNYGILNWGLINEDVMFLQINGMMGFAHYDLGDDPEKAEALYEQYTEESDNQTQDEVDGAAYIMDTIFPELVKTKACIIDLRFNGGGTDEVALKILSYFTKEETTVFSKKAYVKEGEYTTANVIRISPAKKVFNGELYILTSPLSASATEIFVLSSLKAAPNAIRIGSNTEGIFSDILDKQLPNGWSYGLSNEIYESTDGVNYENIGIPAHHHIEYNRESGYKFVSKLQEQKKDEAVEKVLELLKEN